jgi:GNAT superfamily N-acetyltransferase
MGDIEERAHRNLCDFTRWCGRLHPDAPSIDAEGVVAYAGPIDFPTARMAIRSDRSLPADDWAEVVDHFFAGHGKSGCVETRVGVDDDLTELLETRGFREWSRSPEMVCENVLEPRDPPDGFVLRFADSPADISAYARVAAEAFRHLHMTEAAVLAAVDHPDAFLADNCVVALVEADGVPVAGAQALLCDRGSDAYISWVSCADSARGHGLGDTVTRAVTNEAFRRGATLSSLEASQFGEHTYARMGYREIYRYRLLLRM